MMNMLASSCEALKVDPVLALKNNFVLNKLDGSENYLVYNKLFEIVGREMLEFRAKMMKMPSNVYSTRAQQPVSSRPFCSHRCVQDCRGTLWNGCVYLLHMRSS